MELDIPNNHQSLAPEAPAITRPPISPSATATTLNPNVPADTNTPAVRPESSPALGSLSKAPKTGFPDLSSQVVQQINWRVASSSAGEANTPLQSSPQYSVHRRMMIQLSSTLSIPCRTLISKFLSYLEQQNPPQKLVIAGRG
jgi:hypothetical protein